MTSGMSWYLTGKQPQGENLNHTRFLAFNRSLRRSEAAICEITTEESGLGAAIRQEAEKRPQAAE